MAKSAPPSSSTRKGKAKSAKPSKKPARSVTPEIVEHYEEPSTRLANAEVLSDIDQVSDPFAVQLKEQAAQLKEEIEAVGSIEIDPDRDILNDETVSILAGANRSKAQPSSSKALATSDPVATYLAEIRRYPLLTREQEHELAVRYRETQDPLAAELLVTSNLRFVVKVAAEYSRFGAKLIDLVQEGNVGLMHAVKEFNPYKGVRLITYAVWWIRGYIQEYLMRQYSMVRIGTTQNQRKLFYRLQKERDALARLGQEPTVALLAGRLGVTEEEVETMSKRLSGRDVSLSQPLDSEAPSPSLLDFEKSSEVGADEALGQHEELEVLNENLDKIRPELNDRELFLLDKRILADEPLTLQEVGDHFGVTREAVRQLEVRLIGKIRQAVTESLGD